MRALNSLEINAVGGGGWSLNNEPDAYNDAINSPEANAMYKGILGGAIAGLAGGPVGIALGIIGGAITGL